MNIGRVAVAGHSMRPTLRDGDWLLYVAPHDAPRAGHVVVARGGERWLLKRVHAVRDGVVVLASDAPGHGTLRVADTAIVGRVLLRYWPPRRLALF